MERAGRVLGKLRLSSHGVTDEQFATAAWPSAVGKTIAVRTKAVALVRNRLVVEVQDKVWQQQLFTLREQIISQLERAVGRRIVETLEFRIAAPLRKPVATALTATTTQDEADEIRNPILRQIYVASRKKASA